MGDTHVCKGLGACSPQTLAVKTKQGQQSRHARLQSLELCSLKQVRACVVCACVHVCGGGEEEAMWMRGCVDMWR